MKQLPTILFIATITWLSCKKTEVTAPALTGNWVWKSTTNDGAPGPLNPLTPQNTGISQRLSFTDNHWTLIQNGATVSEGSYSTSITKNIFGKNVNAVHYLRQGISSDSVTYYSIAKDTLIFSYDYSGTAGSGSTMYSIQ